MSILRINGLTKRYGDFTAVKEISFEAEAGSLLGFLGVNGAGKSTTINMLSTILTPDGGEAYVCGYRLGKEDMDIRRSIGVVYQSNVLDELLSVRENLLLRAKIAGLNATAAERRLSELTEHLKLDDILKKRYKFLSGGQKRRCEIANALMHSPKILFLDEPTTGLDPATRVDVWETVRKLREKEDMTVFLTTHYMEEAADADKIIIIDSGEIKAEGTPFELKETYARDKLKLYYAKEQSDEIKNMFKDEHISETAYGAQIALKNPYDAVDIITFLKGKIDGFEVIQGNMDDVFLNVTGKENERA
jgi:multidrug/hemolysin transport system ATP-binding protein